MLASIDVALFCHDRQQALGNAYSLLFLGKEVYIRKDVSTWDYLSKQLNLIVYNYEDINNSDFYEFKNFTNGNVNRTRVKKVFDPEYIKKVWTPIFEQSAEN